MDIAPDDAGTTSGVVNTGSATAGVITPVLFGVIVDWTGKWMRSFAGAIVVPFAGRLLHAAEASGSPDGASPGIAARGGTGVRGSAAAGERRHGRYRPNIRWNGAPEGNRALAPQKSQMTLIVGALRVFVSEQSLGREYL